MKRLIQNVLFVLLLVVLGISLSNCAIPAFVGKTATTVTTGAVKTVENVTKAVTAPLR